MQFSKQRRSVLSNVWFSREARRKSSGMEAPGSEERLRNSYAATLLSSRRRIGCFTACRASYKADLKEVLFIGSLTALYSDRRLSYIAGSWTKGINSVLPN